MSLALNPNQQRAWDEAISDPETVASKTRYRVTIGGESFGHLLKTFSYEGSDGPAMSFVGRFGGAISETYEGKRLNLWQVVDGTRYLVFTGQVMIVDSTERGYTTVSASTTGVHMEGSPVPKSLTTDNVDGRLEYFEADPRTALFEVLSPLYGERIDLSETAETRFDRRADESFSWTNKKSEVVEAVREDTGYAVYDNGHSVLKGYLEESLLKRKAPLLTLKAGAHATFVDLVDYHYETRYQERYTRVRVYRTVDGVDILLAEAGVGGSDHLPDKPLDIQTEEPDPLKAQDRASREALALTTDHRTFEATLLYPVPHLDRTDALAVLEIERGERDGQPGRWTKRHVLRVTGFSGDETKRMGIKGLQRTVSETFEADSVSRARFTSSAAAALWGYDFAQAAFLDTDLPWVFSIPEDGCIEVDPDIAAEFGITITTEVENGEEKLVINEQ